MLFLPVSVRARAFGVAIACCLLACPAVAGGDPSDGHSHGPAETAAADARAAPRLALRSELYDFVLLLDGTQLRLFLDRGADNAPVTDATVALSIAGSDAPVAIAPDGTYTLAAGAAALPGEHEMIATISGPAGDDLLVGTFSVPPPPAAAPVAPLEDSVALLRRPEVLGGLGLVVGVLLGFMLRRGRGATLAALAMLVLLAGPLAGRAAAHGDDDHGADAPSQAAGNAPRRLDDGSLHVPKATQRLLVIRTQTATSTTTRRTMRLVGRIIADPGASGLAQSAKGGRVLAAAAGLPRLGQRVSRNDVLLEIDAPIPAGDYSDLAERAGEVEQQITLADAKIARLARLVPNAAPQATLDDARIELLALQRRRDTIVSTRVQREVLRAPVDGVITAANVTLGQVVTPDTVLFHILDPSRLWVEALAFDAGALTDIAGAVAVTKAGVSLPLTFIGRGQVLQSQATRLQFAIAAPGPGPALSVDTPVTVTVQLAAEQTGLILPRSALRRVGAGEDAVFEHIAPERFVARPVRAEPLDGERVLVADGIAPGARIVVQGAELLGQLR